MPVVPITDLIRSLYRMRNTRDMRLRAIVRPLIRGDIKALRQQRIAEKAKAKGVSRPLVLGEFRRVAA